MTRTNTFMTSLAIDTFGIPLAYVIVAALLLWAVITARGSWLLKAVLIAATLLFGVALWHSLTDLQGWPVETGMPRRFEVKWLVVEEPDKKSGTAGSVYVWAVALGDQGRSPFRLVRSGEGGEPRIYRLPYSRSLHEQSEEIEESLRGGNRFFASLGQGGEERGFLTDRPGGEGPGEKGGASDGTVQLDGPRGDERPGGAASLQDYYFHELPAVSYPEKERPAE